MKFYGAREEGEQEQKREEHKGKRMRERERDERGGVRVKTNNKMHIEKKGGGKWGEMRIPS